MSYENHNKWLFLNILFNFKNSCLWWVWTKFLHMDELLNMPSNGEMGKACAVKAGFIKGAPWRDNHKWYKTCKFNPFLYKCYLLVKRRDFILLWRFCTSLMTVFEYILVLFKRPGVPGKTEKQKQWLRFLLLNWNSPLMTQNNAFIASKFLDKYSWLCYE